MCRVLNKHAAGTHHGAIYIGRGSKWGNPFRIGVDGDRAAIIAKHARWLRDQHHLLRALDELRGKDLLCFCAPAACHGDLVLRLANASREKRIAWLDLHRSLGRSYSRTRRQSCFRLKQAAAFIRQRGFRGFHPQPDWQL
jgi:hypothetical protein